MVRRVCKQSGLLFLGILCGSAFAAVLPFHAPVASGTLAVDLQATAAVLTRPWSQASVQQSKKQRFTWRAA